MAAFFQSLAPQAPDALLGLIALFAADGRAGKIDLGVGIYRDDMGATPVLRSVKAAETILLREQPSKSYLGAEGDARFTALLSDLLFGSEPAFADRLTGVQTPGGTGALCLGARLIARAAPGATVWIGSPTWPNHEPIFREAGLAVRFHRFLDPATGLVDLEGMLADLGEARPGDVLLLHGCCHNPSGAQLSPAQWQAIAGHCLRLGLTPFVDIAYQGLGDGLDADAEATRRLVGQVPEALVAYSCDKNFGVYRDRVGALWVSAESSAAAATCRGNLLSLARVLWSMPPDHGAAVVRIVLDDPALRADWEAELAAMRARINGLRASLAAGHPALAPVAAGRGMFALLPVGPDEVGSLREEQAIYMAGNGRINICGLTQASVPALVAALQPHLRPAEGK
ncbi:aspartate/tyrosine/aromatic aminotransferase [Sandaracinobacter sp. RS1-74]|uniref:amino acid aminotransferase n=1 Tax=Sandaracinobacteroides sayramensis TaxID=2913411 RepID=UPI001EDC3F63|nr:amino acid aminotransferase [Sandaracinobacteroides sayramensis]MCG2842067.1 aspartate/tyrosine/aromatic aminotransferase [Sandaracinobacteroides sayramensis]